jgi:hypothetical protein
MPDRTSTHITAILGSARAFTANDEYEVGIGPGITGNVVARLRTIDTVIAAEGGPDVDFAVRALAATLLERVRKERGPVDKRAASLGAAETSLLEALKA